MAKPGLAQDGVRNTPVTLTLSVSFGGVEKLRRVIVALNVTPTTAVAGNTNVD